MIQLSELLLQFEDKIEQYFRRMGWDWSWSLNDKEDVSEIAEGINLSFPLGLKLLHEKLMNMLFRKLKHQHKAKDEEKPKRNLLEELKKCNENLAIKFMEKMAAEGS